MFRIPNTLVVAALMVALAAVQAVASQPPVSTVTVRNADELRRAVAAARPGSRIEMAPGEYRGSFYFTGLRGAAGRPLVIAAADAANPPIFRGEGMQLSGAAFVELHNLVFIGATGNGLNIDDGGSFDTPAHHIVLRGLTVKDVGPAGNHDGIKLSGLDDFRIENCRVENWGTGSGSAIDMVGCHRGVIENSVFRHRKAETEAGTGGSGVQTKGGCRDIVVRGNRFENAGARAINIGGSTDLGVFRPPLRMQVNEPRHEAKNIVVEGNTFIGSNAPVAFVGVDGARVRFNTIYRPQRWALRILQETREPGFVPSRRGEFSDNIVVFRSDEWVEGGVNIGPGTAPETFRFARNFWYCLDDPARSRPTLPTPETGGVYGRNPLLRDAPNGDLRLQPNSPARSRGAPAMRAAQ